MIRLDQSEASFQVTDTRDTGLTTYGHKELDFYVASTFKDNRLETSKPTQNPSQSDLKLNRDFWLQAEIGCIMLVSFIIDITTTL